MAARVTNKMLYTQITGDIQKNFKKLFKIQTSIGSAKRVNRPSDDPAEAGQILKYRRGLEKLDKYSRNMDKALSSMKMADTTLSNAADVIKRARVLAVMAANDTQNADTRRVIAEEVKHLADEFLSISNSILNDQYIFTGFETRKVSFETSGSNYVICEAVAGTSNGYTGTATSSGPFTGSDDKTYIVQIVAGGALDTATYRVSEDNGVNWGTTFPTAASRNVFDDINSSDGDIGVDINFSAGTFNLGDTFTIEVRNNVVMYEDQKERSFDSNGVPLDSNGNPLATYMKDIEIAIDQGVRVVANLDGRVFTGDGDNSDGDEDVDIFQALNGLTTALENNDVNGIRAALGNLIDGTQQLTKGQSIIGSRMNQIEMTKSIHDDMRIRLKDNLSNAEDLDEVQAITDLMMQQNVYQASLQAAARILPLSLLNFI